MEVSQAIYSRRSIRKFKDQRIPREDLVELVEYARLAPSGMNKQPLEFVIVDEPELERELFNYTNWAGAVDWNPDPGERPRAYVLVLINHEVNPATENHDAGLAAGNVCLGAVDKGLGTCLLGAIDKKSIKGLVDIPDGLELDLAIGLGYPDQEVVLEEETEKLDYWLDEEGVFHVPKKPVDEVLHINRWES
ncbi:nitroreductase family protein [Candidatus Bipolaricaulota bacterium]|nr:nitroreductase family protein [Candidatus Bipolaricaulota bacterium]